MASAHKAPDSGVAIIGVSCRLPRAPHLEAYWDLLHRGVDGVGEIPADRWDQNEAEVGQEKLPRWAGLLERIEDFDAEFFNLSPREAVQMDPQQRLLLEESWHCIEDSGIALAALQRATTAVYAGVMATDYRQVLLERGTPIESSSCLGNYGAILANRLSHACGLRGESKTIDAACASSLVALHDARRALLSGEADYALVAAANIICHPWKHTSFHRAHMLSPTGRCRTFSADADGYVPGEGVAVLLLQRTAEARRDGNRIRGIVRGSAVNHCGASLTLTSPSIAAQRDVIQAALASAGLAASAISYVEAHGTGTSLGDPIEVEALRQAFGNAARESPCAIGSVKTNLGHLEAAAGLAGIIKVLLMLREKEIPPSLHLRSPNPIIHFSDTPFQPVTASRLWTVVAGQLRRAGVSSFGFGGVNAHVVIEEAPAVEARPAADALAPVPFIFSARSEASLRQTLDAWRTLLGKREFDSANLRSAAATLATGRQAFGFRVGGFVRTADELKKFLTRTGSADNGAAISRIGEATGPGLYLGLAELGEAAITRWLKAEPRLAALQRENLISLGPERNAARFAFGCALGSRCLELGVEPEWMGGDRIGQWCALVVAGVASVADAFRMNQGEQPREALSWPRATCYRADFLAALYPVEITPRQVDGWCAAVLSEAEWRGCFEQAQQLLSCQPTFARFLGEWAIEHELAGALAQRDAPESRVVLRLFVIVQSCLRRLSRKWELPERPIANDGARALVELVVNAALLPAELTALSRRTLEVETAANAVNARLRASGSQAERLRAALRTEPVEIGTRLEAWHRRGSSLPHPPAGPALWLGELPGQRRSEDFWVDLAGGGDPREKWLEVLVALWQSGSRVDWQRWFADEPFTKVALPLYAFDRKPYWVAPRETVAAKSTAPVASIVPRLVLRALAAGTPNSPAASLSVVVPPVESMSAAEIDSLLPCEQGAGIAVMRLAGKTEHNCFTDSLIGAFEIRLAQAARDPAVKVLVITNDGGHFCAGGTADFIAQLRRGERTFTDLACFYRGILECPIPVIHAVAGHAFGGGLAFALFGDVVVLGAESRYSANFLSLGFSPGMGATLIVPEKLGADLGARLLYTGQVLSGHDLAAAGARVAVAPKNQVLATAMETARELARQSRVSLEVVKRQLAAPLLARLDSHIERELAGHRLTLSAAPEIDRVAASAPAVDAPDERISIHERTAKRQLDPSALASELQAIAGQLLMMVPGDVEVTKPFRELGMDSVLTVELAKAISRRWATPIDAAVLYEHPTIARLEHYLAKSGLVSAATVGTRSSPAGPFVSVSAPTGGSETRAPLSARTPMNDAIAVIGMAGRFPGADDLEAFWRNLANGVDSVSTVPPERWDAEAVFDANPDQPGKTNSRWGGFLREIDRFDPLFFKIPPAEAEAMDPQQRLFLEECWKALEHAGHGALHGAACGVFVGAAVGDYAEHLARAGRGDGAEAFLGLAPSILAARISYLLDLRGPSLAIDTACSSSLVAIHQACQSLRAGECEMALAGGVTLMTTAQLHQRAGRSRMLSPTGRCRPFGSEADGIVLGEGVGVVVLKPLARAVADGDTVHGVIRASAVNQDGATNGITAPSARAQEELIKLVWARAEVAPATIQVVEAHGTGTALGDPIELRALTAALGGEGARRHACALGSVKSNIGHSVCAAGVAGLIKVLLALRHRQIPPSLHFGDGNERIDFSNSPFFVATKLTDWPRGETPRRGAVSSFGFSGTNCHLLVEEYIPSEGSVRLAARTSGSHAFTVSARTPGALARYVAAWRSFIARPDHELPHLGDVAFTLRNGRAALPERYSVHVENYAQLRAALASFAGGERQSAPAANPALPVETPGNRVALPTYPFERVSCWVSAAVGSDAATASFPQREADDPLEKILAALGNRELTVAEAEAAIASQPLSPR